MNDRYRNRIKACLMVSRSEHVGFYVVRSKETGIARQFVLVHDDDLERVNEMLECKERYLEKYDV